MKKILFTLSAIMAALSVNAAVLSTNVVAGGMHLLSANRANIRNIVISSDKNVSVSLYDAASLADPYYGTNYTVGAYPTRLLYTTNYVKAYTNQFGIITYTTNAGLWSVTITNVAATNALPFTTFVVGANTAVSYDVDLLHVNGIAMWTTTNASVVLNYDSGR